VAIAIAASQITSGNLSVANGGTGNTSLTANAVLIGSGTNPVTTVTPGTTGNVLTSNGTNWISQAATGGVTQIIAGTNVTISPSGGTGAVTINASGGGGGGVSNGKSIVLSMIFGG
jgi:hypothetical protein